MKKIVALIAAVLCHMFQLAAQNSLQPKTSFYYYKGEKITVPVNSSHFVVYSTNVTKDAFIRSVANHKVVKEIPVSQTKPAEQRHAYQLCIENNNYDSILAMLEKNIFVSAVEPVIGEKYPVNVSNIFYVKLKKKDDFDKLLSTAENYGVKNIREVPYSNGWYALEAEKKSKGNSLELSGLFWETNLFEDIDPGFIFEFQTNTCVNDSDFNLQWGMNSIQTCSAWSITSGNPNVKVAVIDQGIDENHREFAHTNISYSFDASTYSPQATVYGNHGTHVGGVIFSSHNENRIAGVAPNASMINICHPMYISTTISEEFAVGFFNAIINGAYVITNSWGDQGGAFYNDLHSAILENAIDNALDNGRNGKGCVVVFAAGNYNTVMDYPGTYRDDILTVGAIESSHLRSYFSGHGTKLDVVAPGSEVYSTIPYGYYCNMDGTSMAAPHVAGIAALVLSANPDLTGQQVRDIIERTAMKIRTDQYTYSLDNIHTNGTWNNEMGYGLVNAYAAVTEALTDLYVRDTVSDNGVEPSNVRYQWNSPDIWIEDLYGNPVARPYGNGFYNVCVRVRNRSGHPSSGSERLLLNWAKAGVDLVWSDSWSGNSYFACGQPKGGFIDSAFIPVIPAYGSVVVRMLWHVPSLNAYEQCTEFGSDKWHFCLLARVHDGFPIGHEQETNTSVYQMTLDHNNVAWKNLSLHYGGDMQSVISISNPMLKELPYKLQLFNHRNASGEQITNQAEVYLSLDANLIKAIHTDIIGAEWVNENTLRIQDKDVLIPLLLNAETSYTLEVAVHYLADRTPLDNQTDFDIELRNAANGTIIGGEHYQCIRKEGRFFKAVAHEDKTILLGESVTLYAEDILEPADYRWYDDLGNELGNKPEYTVTPLQSAIYTLRVTADADGYRAYSQVKIDVKEARIDLIAPNPAKDHVTVGYTLSGKAGKTLLQVANAKGQTIYSLSLDKYEHLYEGKTTISTSLWPAGSYTVQLLSAKGKVYDSKTLIIN